MLSLRGVVSVLLLLSLASWLPSNAAAQEDSATQEARSLFEAGRTAYDAGRFESAFDYFQRAYDLSQRPALLFNLGSTAERLRRDADAVDFYERYLAAVPSAENREFVQSRIEFLRSSSHEEREEAERERDPSAPARPAPGGGSVVEEWWFWTIIALVVVGAAVGIGVGVAMSDPGTQAPISGNFGPNDGVAMALVRF